MRSGVTDLARTEWAETSVSSNESKLKRRTSDVGCVCLEGHEDVRGRDAVLLRNGHDGRVREQRGIFRAEGRVRGDNDVLGCARLQHVVLEA
jgi:hypothetical protein